MLSLGKGVASCFFGLYTKDNARKHLRTEEWCGGGSIITLFLCLEPDTVRQGKLYSVLLPTSLLQLIIFGLGSNFMVSFSASGSYDFFQPTRVLLPN